MSFTNIFSSRPRWIRYYDKVEDSSTDDDDVVQGFSGNRRQHTAVLAGERLAWFLATVSLTGLLAILIWKGPYSGESSPRCWGAH